MADNVSENISSFIIIEELTFENISDFLENYSSKFRSKKCSEILRNKLGKLAIM